MVSADAQGHHLLQLEGQRVEVESTVLVQNELAGALGESSSDAMKIVLLLQELALRCLVFLDWFKTFVLKKI